MSRCITSDHHNSHSHQNSLLNSSLTSLQVLPKSCIANWDRPCSPKCYCLYTTPPMPPPQVCQRTCLTAKVNLCWPLILKLMETSLLNWNNLGQPQWDCLVNPTNFKTPICIASCLYTKRNPKTGSKLT